MRSSTFGSSSRQINVQKKKKKTPWFFSFVTRANWPRRARSLAAGSVDPFVPHIAHCGCVTMERWSGSSERFMRLIVPGTMIFTPDVVSRILGQACSLAAGSVIPLVLHIGDGS